ncbi:MAG: hypothetical protein V3S24_00050 [Candidatus Tectomicrobia bacterium]
MQSIHIKTICVLGLAALLPALAFGDELWDKAVKIAANNSSIYPGTMVEHERVYDLKGRLEEYTRSHYRLRFDEQKGLQVTLVKAEKDNVDVTADKAKEVDPADLLTGEDNPFDPSMQPQVTARRARTTTLDGRQVIVYTYTQQTTEALWQGQAYLDATTGVPVKIEAATNQTIQEENMKLSNINLTVFYTTLPDGSWGQDKMLLTMDLKMAVMPLVSFKGKVKSEIEFADFRR